MWLPQVVGPEEEALRSTACGLAQGDPLSAMLFCVTLSHAMDTLTQDCPEVAYGAYVDDVVMTACPASLDRVFTRATDHLAKYGLILQLAKSVLWQTVPVPAHLRPLMSESPVKGLIICGHCLADVDQDELPLRPDDFCGAWLICKLVPDCRHCLTAFARTSQVSRLLIGAS